MNEQIQGYRLSPQQRRAWSLASSDGNSGRASVAVMLDGQLDVERLTNALEAVVHKHEILRTTFRRLPGMQLPLQVVEPAFRPQLTVSPIASGAEAPSIDAMAFEAISPKAAIDAERNNSVPTLSATVTTLAADRHLLVLSMPAMCADAVGLENLVGAIAQAYAAHAGAEPAGDDGDEVLQYVVIADWLNETLESDDSEAGKRFWHGQLADPLAVAPSLGRVTETSFCPGRVAMPIDAATTAEIEQCASRLGTSPAGLLTAAWQVLLWRLWGQSALPIAAMLDGRSTAELTDIIGPLSRHLPVTAAVDGETSFAQIAGRVEAALTEAAAWQECYDAGAVFGGDGQAAKFLPYVVEYRTGHQVHQAGAITLRVIDGASQVERYSLLQSFVRSPDGIDGQLRYDTGRFSAAEAERMAARFQVLLGSIVQDVSAPVASLCILPAAEERTVVVDFNDTRSAFDAPHLVHRLFEAQVARTPQRIAVAFGDQVLTYRQLDACANQLARRLRRHGAGANVPVGLLMERSLDMVVGILGILKAGGAYIPLDAEYPQERIAYMLADSKATVLVTHDRLAATLSSPPATVLRLDTDWQDIATEDEAALDIATDPEDLAYVLYTSGSTGRPKGVMIPHRALCNHMLWMQQRFPIGETDSVLQKTPFSFDASVWEFYAPLFTGGRLVMAQPGGHRDADYLSDTIVREGITTIQLVPTLLRMLLDQPGFERCTSLARVFCGGEALPVDLRDRFHRIAGGELINLYGPTETCIDATYHVCQRGEASMSIGRPIANTEIYLLDEQKRSVPLGVAGELYIGGAGVGLGYLHNPALTAERFIDDPHRPGARMYRTGDLGRHLPDGSIEYLGRIDNQIKLRGHRIELGEIEATLGRHPEVQACMVVVREDQPGDRRLAAYFVARAGKTPRGTDLRHFIKEQLPEYMVPSGFVKLDALPLLPNGKVDQRALPVPADNQADLADTFVAPRNPLEREVAQIWSEVLGVSRVGIHDDFFELGGHSLIATQLTSRIRKLLHVDLPLRELFAAPTVVGLSERIARLQAGLAEHNDVADMLAELEGLSDEEAKALLSEPLASVGG